MFDTGARPSTKSVPLTACQRRWHARRMAAKPRWLFWARGTLLSAICGHWIANTVLDPDQYTRAGLEYTWRASLPIVIQTILILLVVLMLGPLSKRSRSAQNSPAARSFGSSLLMLLATSQLLLFLLMEVSERIVQREPFAEGLLASGFAFELLFAIGSALLLAGLGSAALRVIRSLRRRPTTATIEDPLGLARQHVAPAHELIVVGDVRAPPVVSA